MVKYKKNYKNNLVNKGILAYFIPVKVVPQHDSYNFSLQFRSDNTILYSDTKI